jgi:site-specific DNA-methyltransferase (adenine-specific)
LTFSTFKHDILIGDCNKILPQLEPHSFDALITDPPYGSGGLHTSSRVKPPTEKYVTTGTKAEYANHDFDGDSMDQRSWTNWTTEWLSACRRIVKPGGVAASFIDWRQIAALKDAMQRSGWIVRGIIPWDKQNARPQPARPKQQCEFIIWGSNGSLNIKRNAPYMSGLFSYPAVPASKRQHQSEKPIELMQELVQICERGGRIIDPFVGYGTTICAAKLEGFGALGIEKNVYHGTKAIERLKNI